MPPPRTKTNEETNRFQRREEDGLTLCGKSAFRQSTSSAGTTPESRGKGLSAWVGVVSAASNHLPGNTIAGVVLSNMALVWAFRFLSTFEATRRLGEAPYREFPTQAKSGLEWGSCNRFRLLLRLANVPG